MKCNFVKLLSFSVVISLVLIFSACATSDPKEEALTPVTVQLAWTHQAQFAGMYAADQMGYYADEGLDVSFVEGGPNVDKFSSVLDGSIKFGVGGADELILHRSEGKPLQAIGTVYRISPVVFISLAEKDITRPQDLIGKTVRVSANVAPTLHAMMAWVGIGPDQYSTIELPSSVENFASGETPVWGVYINSIAVAIQEAGYEINIIYPEEYGVHFYADTIFTSDNLIENDPDLVTRFLRATLKGWTYAVENPKEASAFVQNYNPQAEPEIEYSRMITNLPLVYTGEDFIGWMKPETWTAMEKTLREQAVLTQPVDITHVYTLQFLEEIYGETP